LFKEGIRSAEIERQRDQLARWKKEAMTVESWWSKIDAFVRTHPSVTVGDNVAHATLRLLQERVFIEAERDALRADIAPSREAWMPKPPENLREDIIHAINCRSAENGSNTPDWILGDFLMASLEAFDAATMARTRYYKIPDDAPAVDPASNGDRALELLKELLSLQETEIAKGVTTKSNRAFKEAFKKATDLVGEQEVRDDLE
jgi:hypothetical protein